MRASNSSQHQPSVTRWIHEYRGGNSDAAEMLWGFLKSRLIAFAKNKVGSRAVAYDEEDVAIGAFASLCEGLESGRYDSLVDRGELWSLLAEITHNRARKLARDEKRIKRGGNHRRVSNEQEALRQIEASGLDPEYSLLAKEECKRMLQILPNEDLQVLAILKVDGHTNEEIAEILGCTRRSIQRRLNLIRKVWAAE